MEDESEDIQETFSPRRTRRETYSTEDRGDYRFRVIGGRTYDVIPVEEAREIGFRAPIDLDGRKIRADALRQIKS